jgi:hypothetical protein
MPLSINGSGSLSTTGTSFVTYPGAVLQVQAARSGPTKYVITSATPTLITDLSIMFTPKKVGSLLIFNALITSTLTHVTSFGIFKDGTATVSTTGFTNTNQPDMQATSYLAETSTDTREDTLHQTSLMHYETVTSLAAATYGVYGTAGWDGTARSLHINNRSDSAMASFSYFTIMEVAQ